MALDSAKLMQVLDQYQSRLHDAGNEDHDEEIEYVRQIVTSPIFHQFLRGEVEEGGAQIQEASRDLLSSDISPEALVSELTSSEIQKRRLARRKSLKALRNAVMPTSSGGASSAGKKQPHHSSSPTSSTAPHHAAGHTPSRPTEPSSSSATTSATTSPLKHAHHAKSHSGPEIVRTAVAVATGGEPQLLDRTGMGSRGLGGRDGRRMAAAPLSSSSSVLANGGGDIDTPLEGLGIRRPRSPISPRRPSDSASPSAPLLSPRARNLSNSTNTLIERLSPPSLSPTKGHLVSGGRVSAAESQPNVHSLGLDQPEMEKDLFSVPRHVLSPNLVPEWAAKERFFNDSGPVGLSSHPPPHHHSHFAPSTTSHQPHRPHIAMATGPAPQHHLPVAGGNIPRHPPPAPPPYSNTPPSPSAAATHKRSKSFEDILNSPEFDPLNFHRTPIPPHSVLAAPTQLEKSSGTRNQGTLRFDIFLEKGSGGLGFLVNQREGGERGLVVQYLSPGGPAEQDGRLQPNDIITAINGVSLDNVSHSEAVRLLQAVRGVIQLTCLRDHESPPSPSLHPPPSPPTHLSHPPPASPPAHTHSPLSTSPSGPTVGVSDNLQPQSNSHAHISPASHQPHGLVSDSSTNSGVPDMKFNSNTSQAVRQQIRTIQLLPSEGGVGIALSPHSQGGAVVAALLEQGAAKRDGRLCRGDRLLQINEGSVTHMTSEEIAKRLRSLDEAQSTIRLVVAHSEREGEGQIAQEIVPEVMDSSGDEMEEFEVELYKEGRGLGITIAGLVSEDTGEELNGLYITSINSQGAVGKDGRAEVNDRVLQVDGRSLRGLENIEAAAVLRNSGNPVRLVFGRPKPKGRVPNREREKLNSSDEIVNGKPNRLHDSSPVVESSENLETEEDNGDVPVQTSSSLAERDLNTELVRKWKNVMGPNYKIKIVRIVKTSEQGGLGICMESTASLDEMGQPQEGSTRHIIKEVKEGPMKEQGEVIDGDEILQVNNTEVLGLEYSQATEVVKETPVNVMMVLGRRLRPVNDEEEEEGVTERVFAAVELGGVDQTNDDNDGDGSTHDELLAPPTKGEESPNSSRSGSGGFRSRDISRRFERQSWRERHAEERRRLKHRFEQRREEYERHIRELEDELREREKEKEEMMMVSDTTDQEGRGKEGGARERRQSTLLHPSSSPNKFDYSAYHDPVTFTYQEFTEREVGSPDTDSSLSVLSPVPGTGFWEPDVTRIELHKGEEGLGFSILDFADPHCEGERIILVQSLVEGGVAEQDGRLRVGDRLVTVNEVSVANTSLQFAVEQLVMVPYGNMAELGIHHPVLAESDLSDSSSFSPLPPSSSSPSHHHHNLVSTQHFFPPHFQQSGYGAERRSSSLSGAEDDEEEDEEEGQGAEMREGQEDETVIETVEEGEKEEAAGHLERRRLHSGARQPSAKEEAAVAVSERDVSDRRGSLSPLELSRISSPSPGLSLAEMTRVTPEDQERWRQSRESLERQRSLESLTDISSPRRGTLPPKEGFDGPLEIHPPSHSHAREGSRVGVSSPMEPPREGRVKSQLPLETSPQTKPHREDNGVRGYSQVESSSDTTLVGSQSQSDAGMGMLPEEGVSDQLKVKLQPAGGKKSRRSPRGKKSKNSGKKSEVVSKKAAAESKSGSNTLSVSHTHSQVTNTSSQDSIQEGLSPDMSDYDHSSEQDNDPREIHIPKTSSSLGLSLMQDSKTSHILVKSVKGAMRKDGRIRAGDQILAINRELLENLSVAKASKMLKKAASKSEGVTISYIPAPHGFSSSSYSAKSASEPQHFAPVQPNLGRGPSLQGVSAKQETYGAVGPSQLPPSHTNIMAPQIGPPAMSQWTSYPLAHGAAISPLQPPPYSYPAARQAFAQPPLQPPLQPVVWQVQQPAPSALPLGQAAAPQHVAWILREPPHYVDHVVQQQMMSAAAATGPAHFPLSQTMASLPQTCPPPSLPSQAPPPPLSTSAAPTTSSTTTSSAVLSHMSKTPSETKMVVGGATEERVGQKTKPQGKATPRHPPHPYTVYRRRQQQQAQAAAAAAAAASRGRLPDNHHISPAQLRKPPPPSSSSSSAAKSHDYSRRLQNMSHDFSDPSVTSATNRAGGQGPQQHLRNSIDREVQENPELRKEFPNVEGTLFEVWLNKGNRGLGMSIVANRNDHTPGPRGIVIMGIQPGGVADRSKMIMWGDMILKINDTRVIGMSQLEVQEMLMQAAPQVRFLMLRQAESRVLERTIHQQPPNVGNIIGGLPQVHVVQLYRDNEKGLGFTVEEEGEGGVVTVASITPGGPAEKEGTLKTGDQLISIDGLKILGYSAEKARHLLQQARSRGWVHLIVSSRGGSAGPGEEGSGGSFKTKVPDSVVLRQKKRSKNSLKSSRRRPVSVDSESSIVRATSTSRARDLRTAAVGGSSAADQGEMVGTAEHRAVGSGVGDPGDRVTGGRGDGGEIGPGVGNRNSHTLTEKDVELGFQRVEKHNVIVPGRESRITIFKGSQVLGVTVVGGVDTYLHNIIIERIIPGSPAATDSRLLPGDRLLEVNDVSLDEATCEDALAALQHPSPFIHITVLRIHSQEPAPHTEPTVSPTPQVETVELVKPAHGGLGLLIQESPEQNGVYVTDVVENQAAFLDGRIKPGDKILAINHTSTAMATQDTVFKLLQSCVGKIVLTVQHHNTASPATSTIDFSDSHSKQQHLSVQASPPGGVAKYSYLSESQPSHVPHRDPPPYPVGGRNRAGHAIGGPVWGSGHSHGARPPSGAHRSGEGKIRHVNLRKGPKGLGFTIVGGAGSSHGDKPIYVNRVLEDGVAGQLLFKGDQLLAVNGINFEGVTHKFAAETLKQQSRHGDVELTVLSFE